jgi:hypothetical protein
MTMHRLFRLALLPALLAAPLAHATDPVRLSKEETQQALSGKSMTYGGRSGAQIMTFFSADGKVTQRTLTSSRTSSGTWTVEDDGRFCLKIISGTGSDACRHLLRTDTGFAMSTAQGGGTITIDKLE